MRILVTGGAGYIGSHIVLEALKQGHSVTVFDNLSTGSVDNINEKTKFVQGSTLSTSDLKKLFEENTFDAVIHMAASKAAGESMKNPSNYATNNILGGINLINVCSNYGIKIFIFSSSAAVYGLPEYIPIDESHSLNPSNYYGYTKLALEQNLKWFSELRDMNYASLRYFNAAGYDLKKRVTGMESNPQNLIPLVMEVAIGTKSKIDIYGNDYSTIDGTGVRDYVHVNDLAIAHIKAISYLKKERKNITLNLGTGVGFSVLEVVNKVREVSGKNISFEIVNRREGDPDTVIAKADLAKKLINWESKFSDLDSIIASTWDLYKDKTSF
tara:strand:+ start:145 stop:1125 length:981 start_codon:yes stop_codon:yes gene_type:complete